MPEPADDNGGEVSDAMSENDNEYDDPNLDDDDKMLENGISSHDHDGHSDTKKKYDPKNPARPKRKKARRACFACQRAHLTCGDERPCTRCIKRGIQGQCQDGVRKKAKYLHDAPAEALRPVLGPTFPPGGPSGVRPHGSRQPSNASETISVNGNGSFFSPQSQTPFPVYHGPQTPVGIADGLPYSSQPSPVSPNFQGPPNSRPSQVPGILGADPINFAMFEHANPAMFNFDLESINFTSQYGALEWGILGHMSSGAVETPSREQSVSQTPGTEPTYGPMFNPAAAASQFGQVYNPDVVDLMNLDHGGVLYANGNLQHGLPHAYAIATGPANLASPPDTENTASPGSANVHDDVSPTVTPFNPPSAGGPGGPPPPPPPPPHSVTHAPRPKHKTSATKSTSNSLLGKKKRDASWIYSTITEPYSYLAGFHNLIAYLQRRFSPSKTVHIAKFLASIRPSFMSCVKSLNRQDLVMMERVFQRTLMEYETFLDHNSSPAIVCRRTGEVVAANNQFTALTGWTKDVLLGNEPNLNVNTGGNNNTPSVNERDSITTPQLKTVLPDNRKSQPVFIAELLDDDSVVKFYEDFAFLAFEDSRGNRQRKGRLLKYRTKENDGKTDSPQQPQVHTEQPKGPRSSILSNRVTRIDGEHGISRIEKDGKVDCTYCWCIKRDPFDIPMMIVINFLPCYDRTQTPHRV